ncbi:hypothetical protein Hanom_Chr16g01474941 [Helianthus anomalus]
MSQFMKSRSKTLKDKGEAFDEDIVESQQDQAAEANQTSLSPTNSLKTESNSLQHSNVFEACVRLCNIVKANNCKETSEFIKSYCSEKNCKEACKFLENNCALLKTAFCMQDGLNLANSI